MPPSAVLCCHIRHFRLKQCVSFCPQVYEHLVFEGSQHISLRSLEGMRERSIRIGSAGKTFSFTSWKVGVSADLCLLTSTCSSESQTAAQHSSPASFATCKGMPSICCHYDILCWSEAPSCAARTCWQQQIQILRLHDWVQIGWVTGPPALISAIAKAHQFLVFTVPSNLQRAVAHGLDNESSFFT